MNAITELAKDVGLSAACDAFDIPRSTYYRYVSPSKHGSISDKAAPPLALTSAEKAGVLQILTSDRFCDKPPYQVYATLLDEGTYLCSISTMYRILHQQYDQVKDRRNQTRHQNYTKPELLATAPNQVWSWDITKLKTCYRWTYYYLYVIIDIYSRYVVGWMVAHRESAVLAKILIRESCLKQNIQPGQLIIHADRGSSMKSKTVAELLIDLGITKSHSRPYVSNDNPFSEAQFKTLKYCPEFPERFGPAQEARDFCQFFFIDYNSVRHHTGLALMTPEQVHYGMADAIYQFRTTILNSAFEQHPERFKNKLPKPPSLPEAVYINKPKKENDTKNSA